MQFGKALLQGKAKTQKTKKERIQKMNIIHCENCRFWQDGYCTLRKKETCDGATCDKAEEY